ncbi:hypothetical protein HK103_005661 [Boothiomyces macroporosus]|uniref:Uncharacterized protein n=1 Tax=Boothiomyces macroporosus TaxID=261099 RepID=A0AAD5UEV8_9FUNG|nr:hypothetical protein HK103_005661 [Boothiomyces macroporosus]
MGTNITISEIKDYLDTLYDLKGLSEVAIINKKKQDEEIPQEEFTLPFEEYEELIDKLRKADEASEGTPPKKKAPALSLVVADIPTCGGSSQKSCPKGLSCVVPGGNTIGLCLNPSEIATNTITARPAPTDSTNGTFTNGTATNSTTTMADSSNTTTTLPTTTTGPPPTYPTPQQPNSAFYTGASVALMAILLCL